jgi:CheY-like chemotaxis protein
MQTVSSGDPPPRKRIRKLLLAGNPYDAFLLEEAGFRPPGQDEPADAPSFDLVRSGDKALARLGAGEYDMLLANYALPDLSGDELAARVQRARPGLPVALVTSNTELGGVSVAGDQARRVPLFIWYGAHSFLWGLIRLYEDELSAPALVTTGHALAILLVEDEPNFYSHFVPLLYERVRASGLELTPAHKRPRSIWESAPNRPLVLLRRNFEDSCEVLYRFRAYIMAVITDMTFPVKGELKTDAGLRLLYRARAINGHMPVAVHSHEREHEGAAQEARAKFLWKDSPHLLADLDHFLLDSCGFGPFIFRWPAGDVYGVAHNLAELRALIADVPEVVFEHHALHFDFSAWLAVHGHGSLARVVRELSITDYSPRQDFLAMLDETIAAEREEDGATVDNPDPGAVR